MKFTKSNKNKFFDGLKERVDFYFAGAKLSRYANLEIVIKSFIIISVYVAAYASIFLVNQTPVSLCAAYIILGLSGVMIVFNLVHDASHHALSKKKWINDYGRYVGDLVGINTYIWNIRHNIQHHSFTNVLGGDLIIENIPLLRLSPHQPYKKFHRYQLYYAPFLYMLYSFYWMFIIDFRLFMRKEICNLSDIRHPKREWFILISSKAVYVSYIIILPWLFTPLTLMQASGLFLLMHIFAGLLLSTVAVLGHFVEGPGFPKAENGLIHNSWSEHELEATIDFAPGSRIINWITGGLNTHVAHHLFPNICHTHYYKLTPIIEAYCKSTGYLYKKESLVGALSSHIRFLKKLSYPNT